MARPAFAQAPPSAADKETARTLMDRGDDRFEARDYAGALKAFREADAIMHLPVTGTSVARAQEALGLLLEARDTALEVTRLPAPPGENALQAGARSKAQALADALATRIPSLAITVSPSPAGLSLSIDGTAVPAGGAEPALLRKVNPGRHVVVARAPGYADARAEVMAAEGATLAVPLELHAGAGAAPPPPDAPMPANPRSTSPLVYAGFGVGAVGLIAGAVTGGLSIAKTSKLAQECSAKKVCTGSAASDVQTATLLANVSNVSLAVGGAGVVLGVVGLVLSRRPSPSPSASLTPFVGLGTAGVQGTF